MSADTNADMFSNLGPEFGGSSGVEAERSPLLSRAAGAVELIAGGAWNSVVRIAGGVASVSFLLDSADAAMAVQQGFEDKLAYQPKTEGAREIVQALQPVAQYVGGKIDAARSYSESKIGDGATTLVFAGGQFALEAASTYFGGRAAMAALEGRAAVGAAQATGRSAVAELADGVGDVAATATRSVDNVAATALDASVNAAAASRKLDASLVARGTNPDVNAAHSAYQYELLKRDLLRQELANPGSPTSGPVVLRQPVAGATDAEVQQIRDYADLGNLAIDEGYMSPTGRVSTSGAMRVQASSAARAEARRALAEGRPYTDVVGHGPDTTWTGRPQAPFWLDMDGRSRPGADALA